jgi:uncharacterized membrane protein YjgN (DUF898 family)
MPAMTQQPPPGYGPPPGCGGYGPPAPNHPQATTTLVLGILGLVVCGLIGPFAWSMGNRVVREIDASGGRWGGRTEANVGRVLGIVSTVLLVGGLLLVVLVFVFGAVFTTSFSTSN